MTNQAQPQPVPTSLKEFIPLDALAETFGVSRSVVRRWRDVLGMPVIRLDARRCLVHEGTLAQWLKSRETVRPAEE